MTQTLFYFLAGFAVVTASLCILQRNPMTAVLWLVGTMLSLAGIYVILNAQFVAAIQVLVYAGAVMVLFLFVIMLLNLGHDAPRPAGAAGAGGGDRHHRAARGGARRPVEVLGPAPRVGGGPGTAVQRPGHDLHDG